MSPVMPPVDSAPPAHTSLAAPVGQNVEILRLAFQAGTITLTQQTQMTSPSGPAWGAPQKYELPHPTLSRWFAWDDRSTCFRAPAIAYAATVATLVRSKTEYVDEAKRYTDLSDALSAGQVTLSPRPYQAEALEIWRKNGSRGVVVLPTGAGKTLVAVMAIRDKKRGALVIAPTLDLVRQWYDLLRIHLHMNIGIVGGGEHDVQPVTVTTYDSAYLHMDYFGNRFGTVVFDECHHLPSSAYSLAARACLAPFRLGLTATPERGDGGEALLGELIGPTVYRRDIVELAGDYLAEYEIARLEIELSAEERISYDENRAIYRAFVDKYNIRMSSPEGWQRFLQIASRTQEGWQAIQAYRKQRALALASPAKIAVVEQLLTQHHQDRTLIFTQDNATAYDVARRFLIPIITHQTKIKERSEILAGFKQGKYRAIATSKVLNEGVDVPDANIAIVMSGSASVREHVQRLGRILRKSGDKRAVLYELVSANTSETYTSQRRREHSAYKSDETAKSSPETTEAAVDEGTEN